MLPGIDPRFSRALAAGLCLVVTSCSAKQALAPTAPAERLARGSLAAEAPKAADPADRGATVPMPIDPDVRVGHLDNGLRYYLRAHENPARRAALRLVVDAGSVLETDEQRGLAHFIEHMAFNGTRRFRKQEIVDYFEKVGMRFGSDANASTTFDETTYSFTVPTDDPAILAKALLILEQMAHEVAFEPDEVERERGVIIEEWRLGLGAEMRTLEQLIPVLFAGSRYAERLPIGKMTVLQHATPADLRGFYRRWYRPDLMAVAAVGDFDVAAVEAEIQRTFAQIPKPADAANRPAYVVPAQSETQIAVAQDPELPSTSVSVLHKMPRRPDASEGDYRRHIVENLFHEMLSARLDELTRTAQPPFLSAVSTTEDLVRPVEVFAELAAVKPQGATAGLEALAREVERVDRHGFTPGELARAKAGQLRRMSALVKERENLPSDAFADEMVRHFLTGEAMPGIAAELRLHQRYLPSVQLAEMNVIAHDWLQARDRVIVVQAPKSVTVPPREALLGILRSVEAAPVPAYVDHFAKRPLLPKPPAPGRIASTRTIDAIGVTEWRLSNGVRVVVKPTDFKEDEVLMAAFSPGGTSLVSDADYRSARFADDIVAASGFGSFDPTELRNVLADKLVEVTPHIGEVSEGVAGGASPEDLESFFELVDLVFTAPRRDAGAFASFQAQLGDALAQHESDPQGALADRHEVVLFGNHPRRRPLRPGDEAKISLDRALRVYRARFANPADFTFVFVGRASLETLAPLVKKYLGGLATRPTAHETWRDLGVRPVPGVHEFEVDKGLEPKSVVKLTFTGDQRWTRLDDHLLQSLTEAMEIRLREVLREDMSEVYGISVAGSLQRRPHEEFRVDVSFACAPQNVDGLVAAVFREIDGVKAGQLAPAIVEKVQAAQGRAFEQGQRSNRFWLGQLASHYQFRTDPTLITREPELIAQVTPQSLAAAAKKYFDRGRYVLGVLRPAAAAVSSKEGGAAHKTPPAAASGAR